MKQIFRNHPQSIETEPVLNSSTFVEIVNKQLCNIKKLTTHVSGLLLNSWTTMHCNGALLLSMYAGIIFVIWERHHSTDKNISLSKLVLNRRSETWTSNQNLADSICLSRIYLPPFNHSDKICRNFQQWSLDMISPIMVTLVLLFSPSFSSSDVAFPLQVLL